MSGEDIDGLSDNKLLKGDSGAQSGLQLDQNFRS